MHCIARCVGLLAVVAVIVGAAGAYAFRHASAWLTASDEPHRAAAIVVLGDEPTRALEGAHLYAAQLAPRVLLAVPMRAKRHQRLEAEGVRMPWFEETGELLLRKHGVPADAIGRFGHDLKSTAAEGAALAALVPPGETVIVVTSPYHVRRARMILADALPGRTVLVVGSRYEPLPERWWTDQEAARNVILEALKFAYYLGGGRFS